MSNPDKTHSSLTGLSRLGALCTDLIASFALMGPQVHFSQLRCYPMLLDQVRFCTWSHFDS